MPIYLYGCAKCQTILEKIENNGATPPVCFCGMVMGRLPTYPIMVKVKGDGGYPSQRKFVKGTAPYTTRSTKAWLDEDPIEQTRKMQPALEANKRRR